MEDFEESYRNAIEAGQRNLETQTLLSNWCFHAEFVRTPGRGLIEAQTGLPIGHMGVQCKHSKSNSMYCWLLEDAVYNFYQNNCKSCEKRVPVGFPNILSIVDPREREAENRRQEREEEKKVRKDKQAYRRQDRARLRSELSLEETFVLDLLDDLDQENIAGDDPRLEELAALAPETFTKNIVSHLMPAVLNERLPYSIPVAKALLRASLEPEERLSVAVCLVTNGEMSSEAIEVILSEPERLKHADLIQILDHFVFVALGPPPGIHFGDEETVSLDATPILSLFQKKNNEICLEVDSLIGEGSPEKIGAAVEIILAVNDDKLFFAHANSIFSKLMRRRTFLPRERRDSSVLYYLREAASRCLNLFPETADKIIQSFLADKDDTGRDEAYRIYTSVLSPYFQRKMQINEAQRLAFKRLLWAAVEHPDSGIDHAVQFFMQARDEFAELAANFFAELIGAAATLTEKYEQVDKETYLELADNMLSQVERSSKRSAISTLQKALVEWAAVGAKYKGNEGIEHFLELYRKLPENQTQMRGSMIVHFSKLLTGVESLTIILPDWYRALLDVDTLIRARAVQAWEDVPYSLEKHFPDLFLEAFSLLLKDPYVIVHQSVVHSLRRRSFPEKKRGLIKQGLWNLIFVYFKESNSEDFIVDCIETFLFLCLSDEGKQKDLLLEILLTLDGSALYHAVDRLHYNFRGVPGFAKVALKSIQDDYTRSISTDDCASAILSAPCEELLYCTEEILKAFDALQPFRKNDFVEALLYAAALGKAGNHEAVSACFKKMLASISVEKRNEQWRVAVALVALASEIEHAIGSGDPFDLLIERWGNLLADLETV